MSFEKQMKQAIIAQAVMTYCEAVLEDEEGFKERNKKGIIEPNLYVQLVKELKEDYDVRSKVN